MATDSELDGAEVVRGAARLSLAARGVRLYRARAREADGGWTQPWSWEVGIGDPAARSVQLRHFHAEDSPVRKLAEAASRRWPWLDDDSPPDPGAKKGEESIEIGRKDYYGGSPQGWLDWSDMEFHGPARALWPLEAVLGTTHATHAGVADVRGETCNRYVTEVLPGKAVAVEGVQLVDPPQPDDYWRALHADVCIDSAGLIRRIAWSPAFERRFKPGLLPRAAAGFAKDPPSTHEAKGRLWYLTELWDYGCRADITAPTNLIDTQGASLRTIVRDLWRMRREYKKRTPRQDA